MRLVSYYGPDGIRAAVVREDGYVDVGRAAPSFGHDLATVIARLDQRGREVLASKTIRFDKAIPFEQVKLAAPIPRPEKILCIGLNYADHVAESGRELPSEPVVFSKFVTAVCAPDQPIVLPRASQEVDYEAELVAVIGRGGRQIPRDQALDHVAGYCCGHDVSARDWQLKKPGGQWLLGKSFDTFAPMGPWLVTPDEVGDPHNLRIRFRRNGETLQDSSTSQLIFRVDHLIAHISQVCTLSPGDVIFTGTPPGVGNARNPKVFLQPGDVVEVEIERLSVLRNPVISAV